MVFFSRVKHEDGYTIHARNDPQAMVGFWLLDEKQSELALKCLNGAFEDGVRYALARLAELNGTDLRNLFPELYTPFPEVDPSQV